MQGLLQVYNNQQWRDEGGKEDAAIEGRQQPCVIEFRVFGITRIRTRKFRVPDISGFLFFGRSSDASSYYPKFLIPELPDPIFPNYRNEQGDAPPPSSSPNPLHPSSFRQLLPLAQAPPFSRRRRLSGWIRSFPHSTLSPRRSGDSMEVDEAAGVCANSGGGGSLAPERLSALPDNHPAAAVNHGYSDSDEENNDDSNDDDREWEDFEDFAENLMHCCNIARLDSLRLRVSRARAPRFADKGGASWSFRVQRRGPLHAGGPTWRATSAKVANGEEARRKNGNSVLASVKLAISRSASRNNGK